jgi:hypothetical protein
MPDESEDAKTREWPIAEVQRLSPRKESGVCHKQLKEKNPWLKKLALIAAAPFIVLLSPVLVPLYIHNRRRKGKPLFSMRRLTNQRVVNAPRMAELSGRRQDVSAPVLDQSAEAKMAARPDSFVLYRIIGNDLVPRHARGQSYSNVEFILLNEPAFKNCEKRWVLNRIFDAAERARIKDLLDAHGQVYFEIPFSWDEFSAVPYDFSLFPDGFFTSKAFDELDEDERVRARVMSYRQKNNYVMNNNGARNSAIEEGQRLAKWVLPWDGNCFLTYEAWQEISEATRTQPRLRYFTVPMARMSNNADLLGSNRRPDAREEPQVIFRSDAPERFDARHPYGRRPKVELLLRLGVPGPWESWRLDPWDEPPRKVSPEAHRVGEAGWVARLFSGAPLGEQSTTRSFKHRGRLREEAIVQTIDLVETLALRAHGYSTDTCLFYDCEAIAGMADRFGPAWSSSFLTRAEEALRRPRFSILDKTTLPPSGDARDYWHPAPYWWPDPRRPDGLPYVKKDGERVPGTEVFGAGSEKYDRTRLQTLFDDVAFLAIAWKATGDKRYRTRALGLLDTWFMDRDTSMNPSLAYAQVRMGHDGNRGQSWGLIESKDMYYFLDAVRLLGEAEEVEALRGWAGKFLDWMQTSGQGRSEARAANNHGTCYDLQVASLAAFTGDVQTLIDTHHRAQSRIAAQFQEDGVQPEEMRRTLTQHYCAFNLQSWVNLFTIFDALGMHPWNAPETRRIEAAARRFLAESEGAWPHRQIAPFDPRRLEPLKTLARRRNLGDYPNVVVGETVPVVFHPDDGIAPLWELSRAAGR